ncbi:hypothetical protein Goshw_020726 [Gossypium schwendimanii]|uniref:Uncharacterized protein n=3 Tax=Gossypium TaxID=3633 RepID=A0A7J8P103_GOSRA|nr:hypothetical protein [Gossypium lobatum]MBA0582928.1 hypothetical protein [Gossypium raimondii]MBA0582929.1 hypothetical protein [Gossypium raimondii]MBA0851491.1 hypothetical protein [Gossypium schwendimanii]
MCFILSKGANLDAVMIITGPQCSRWSTETTLWVRRNLPLQRHRMKLFRLVADLTLVLLG